MLKKILLSALLTISTLTTAQINLDLDMTVAYLDTQRHLASSVTINENIPTSFVFDDMETLILNFIAQTDNEIVNLGVQFFQKINNDELITATDPIMVQVPFNQPATITVHDSDNNGLILVITPTMAE